MGAAAVLEREVGQHQRVLGDIDGGDLATGEGRDFLGQFDRRLAFGVLGRFLGGLAGRIACQGRNPVYPGQTDEPSGEAGCHDQREPFFAETGR